MRARLRRQTPRWGGLRVNPALSRSAPADPGETNVNTHEMIQAAAVIAAPMAAAVADRGQLTAALTEAIARTAVTLAKKIEDEARHAYSAH